MEFPKVRTSERDPITLVTHAPLTQTDVNGGQPPVAHRPPPALTDTPAARSSLRRSPRHRDSSRRTNCPLSPTHQPPDHHRGAHHVTKIPHDASTARSHRHSLDRIGDSILQPRPAVFDDYGLLSGFSTLFIQPELPVLADCSL